MTNYHIDINLDKLPSLKEVLKDVEASLIKERLQLSQGNQSMAARSLKMSRSALVYKMKEYKIYP